MKEIELEGSNHNTRIYSGSANKDTFLVPTTLPESRFREFFFTMSTSSLLAEKTVTRRCLFFYRHKAKCRVLILARTNLTTHHNFFTTHHGFFTTHHGFFTTHHGFFTTHHGFFTTHHFFYTPHHYSYTICNSEIY